MGCVLPQAPPSLLSWLQRFSKSKTLSSVNSISASVVRMYVLSSSDILFLVMVFVDGTVSLDTVNISISALCVDVACAGIVDLKANAGR